MDNVSSRFPRRDVRDAGCQSYAMAAVICCTVLAACSGQAPGTVSGTATAQPVAPVVVTRASTTDGVPLVRSAGGEVRDTPVYKTLAPGAQPAPAKAPVAEVIIERELGTASDGGYMAY